MGNNDYGRLGNGNTSSQYSPIQVIDSGVAQVAGGNNHSLFLKDDGSLWAMGYNYHGQLGNGQSYSYTNSTPIQVIDSGAALSSQSTGGTGDGISLYVADHFIGRLSSVLPEVPKVSLPDTAINLPLDSLDGNHSVTSGDLTLVGNRFGEANSSLAISDSNASFTFTDANDTIARTLTAWVKPEASDHPVSLDLGNNLALEMNASALGGLTVSLSDDLGNELVANDINASTMQAHAGWFQFSLSRTYKSPTYPGNTFASSSVHSHL